MAITTVYNPQAHLTTSMNIFKEFLETYITDCDFILERPNLDENTSIAKPILFFEAISGYPQNMGLGRKDGSGNIVKDYIIEIKVNIILDYNTGGSQRAKEIGEKITYMVFKYGYLLGQAGLRNPQIAGLREVSKNPYSPFFGGTQVFTARVQLI